MTPSIYLVSVAFADTHGLLAAALQPPLEPFLCGRLGLLPLAPLCQLPAGPPLEQSLQAVVHQIDERLASDVSHADAVWLMTATFVLTGMRVRRETLTEVFRGVRIMHESSAFDLYEEKGRVEESQRLLMRLGTRRFGTPDPASEAALKSVRDLDRLERLADAVLTAHSWQDFLATP